MTTTKTDAPKKRSRKPAATEKRGAMKGAEQPPQQDGAKPVRNFRNHAKRKVQESFPAIVSSLVDGAKQGNLGKAKLLFDLGGVKEQAKEEQRRQKRSGPAGPSLAELLLKEVQRRDAEKQQTTESGAQQE